jgi:hypothetical protein
MSWGISSSCCWRGTLHGLSHRLQADGYDDAAEVVSDLAEVLDDYLEHAQMCTASTHAPFRNSGLDRTCAVRNVRENRALPSRTGGSPPLGAGPT